MARPFSLLVVLIFTSLSAHAISPLCTYTSDEALETLSEPNATSALDCALKLAQKYMTKYKEQIRENGIPLNLYVTELRYGSTYGWNYNPLRDGAVYTFVASTSQNSSVYTGSLAVLMKQNGRRYSCYTAEVRTSVNDVIAVVKNSKGEILWSRQGAEKECPWF